MFKNSFHLPLKPTAEPDLAKVETILEKDPEILNAIRFLVLAVGTHGLQTAENFEVPEQVAKFAEQIFVK